MPTSSNSERDWACAASLAEPVRLSLYRYVIAQPEPVSREQAALGVGVAHHVAKFHLDRLVADELLEFDYRRPPGRSGPGAGRPAKVYKRSDRQIELTLPERRYELAARLLARAVVDAERDGAPVGHALRRAAADVGEGLGEEARRRAGRRASRRTLTAAATEVLRDQGYEPRQDRGGITLVNCPFDSLAHDHAELVCGMNLDLMEGLVRELGADRLEAVLDPAPARCCVRLAQRLAERGRGSAPNVTS